MSCYLQPDRYDATECSSCEFCCECAENFLAALSGQLRNAVREQHKKAKSGQIMKEDE